MTAVAVRVAALLAPTLVAACGSSPGSTTDAIVVFPSDAGPDAVTAPDADITMCSTELTCPTPDNGRVSICGRLRDVETNALLEQPGALGETCDPDAPTADGPCSVRLAAYSAIDFVGAPTTTPPLPTGSYRLDTCGRYLLGNVVRPQVGGYVGIGIHDVSGTDARLLSGAAVGAASGEARVMDLWSLRATTDAAWQTSAGLVGEGFHARGAVLMLFHHDAMPVTGVIATAAGSTVPALDHYFSDTTGSRLTIDGSRSTTGANGAALLTGTGLVDHGATGGEPDGCHWTAALAASIPGVLLVTERAPADEFNGPCPTGGSGTTVTE